MVTVIVELVIHSLMECICAVYLDLAEIEKS